MKFGEEYPCPYCHGEKLNCRYKTVLDERGIGYDKTQWYCTKCGCAGPFLKDSADDGWKKISRRKPQQMDIFCPESEEE